MENILSLGILGNPFFYRPCISLLNYASVEMYYMEDNEFVSIRRYRYSWGKEVHADGTFSLIHPQVYGEKLKKHAYFFMAALAHTSASYVAYLEKSILDSI